LFVSLFFEEKRLKRSFLILFISCNIYFVYFFDLEKFGGNLSAIFLGLNLIVLFKNSLGIELPLRPFTQSFKGLNEKKKEEDSELERRIED
jgi:hypothetical protein